MLILILSRWQGSQEQKVAMCTRVKKKLVLNEYLFFNYFVGAEAVFKGFID